MVFPVIHSTLDPQALSAEVTARYLSADDAVRCRLMSRANNDFYDIAAGSQRFALRVAKAAFRPSGDYVYELELLEHLDRAGLNVPGPMRTKDGDLFFEVEAPEGPRTVALFKWMDGRPYTKNLTVEDARAMGGGLAELHLAGADFKSTQIRRIGTGAYLSQHLPQLLEMMKGQPDDAAFYAQAAPAVIQGHGPDRPQRRPARPRPRRLPVRQRAAHGRRRQRRARLRQLRRRFSCPGFVHVRLARRYGYRRPCRRRRLCGRV